MNFKVAGCTVKTKKTPKKPQMMTVAYQSQNVNEPNIRTVSINKHWQTPAYFEEVKV